MNLKQYTFRFDHDLANLAREAAAECSLIADLGDARADSSVVMTVKGDEAALDRFAAYAAANGAENLTHVDRFYIIPADAALTAEELVDAAARYRLKASSALDDATLSGELQIEIRDQQKVAQDKFESYLNGIGIKRVQ